MQAWFLLPMQALLMNFWLQIMLCGKTILPHAVFLIKNLWSDTCGFFYHPVSQIISVDLSVAFSEDKICPFYCLCTMYKLAFLVMLFILQCKVRAGPLLTASFYRPVETWIALDTQIRSPQFLNMFLIYINCMYEGIICACVYTRYIYLHSHGYI